MVKPFLFPKYFLYICTMRQLLGGVAQLDRATAFYEKLDAMARNPIVESR